jgi:hypothetical protein
MMLYNVFSAAGWGFAALFLMLWVDERRWSVRCYAAYTKWKEWGSIIGAHANEMWAELSRRRTESAEPPPLRENLTVVMPQDMLKARVTGMMPRFKFTREK